MSGTLDIRTSIIPENLLAKVAEAEGRAIVRIHELMQIIEREWISVEPDLVYDGPRLIIRGWTARCRRAEAYMRERMANPAQNPNEPPPAPWHCGYVSGGRSPLEAAMRAYVVAKFGPGLGV